MPCIPGRLLREHSDLHPVDLEPTTDTHSTGPRVFNRNISPKSVSFTRFSLLLGAVALTVLALIVACGSDEPTRGSESSRADRPTSSAESSETDRPPSDPNTPPAEESGRLRSIISRTSAVTDREALIALYNATGGPNWLQNENWLSDEPIGEWYGVEPDDEERVTGLYLSGNNLIGEIPPDIANLDKLTLLDLQQNFLSGEIPPELGNLSSLKFLVIPLNQLSGEIPMELGGLANLEMLGIHNNQLSGDIPPELGRLSNLRVLTLNDNQLTGEIPPELGELASLTDLNLQNNLLGREIPAELGNLRNLKNLSLTSNRLNGEIPPELGSLANLNSLLIGDNRIQGEIPPELGNLSRLTALGLYLNQLRGEIPPELGSMANLERLLLGGNQLSGWLPPELGNLSHLRILAISKNPLEGCVPNNLERQLDLSQSNLGHLPFCTVIALGTPPPAPQATPSGPQATRPVRATPAPQATLPRPQPTTRSPQATRPVQPTPAPTPLPQATGGPGAVYRSDGNWGALAGPAVYGPAVYGLGDYDGQVPVDAILQHKWIYESDYYRSLLKKARLNNPTPLTSSGHSITLQHACVSRSLNWCSHLEAYFAPNVEARTNGQVRIEISSFLELGISGRDTATLLLDGTLTMGEIHGSYLEAEFPSLAIQSLWGLWPDDHSRFQAQTAMAPDLDRIVAEEMGAQALFRNWIADGGAFLFSNDELERPEDFEGLRIRSFGDTIADWIRGMGGEPRLVAFAEVYTDLERGTLDVGVTNAAAGFGQRWFEVSQYINGPLYSFGSSINAINHEVWDNIPSDLQQILIEEGAKHELEALRLAAVQGKGSVALERWLQLVEFGPEIRAKSNQVARECVIPGWLGRMGYASTGGCIAETTSTVQSTTPGATPSWSPTPTPTASERQMLSARGARAVDIFNHRVGPIVGLRIEADGTVTELR